MMRRIWFLLGMMSMMGCVPKYQFVHQDRLSVPIQHIDVVMDFVTYVDDVGEWMDYDEAHNQLALDALKDRIHAVLTAKGYDSIAFISLSSGATLHPELDFELYVDRVFQEQLISPPFYMVAEGIGIDAQDRLLATMKQFQSPAMVPVGEKTQKYLHRLTMTPQLYDRELSVRHSGGAVLFVQVSHPRVSLVKSVGVSMVSTVSSHGISGGALITTSLPYGKPHSQSLLFDWNSGGLIWKNHSQGLLNTMSSASLGRYFSEFPMFK